MPDATPTPSPEPDKHHAPRGPVNQADIDALDKAEKVANAANSAEFAAALTEREIDGAFINTLLADIGAARRQAGGAVAGSAAKEQTTKDEAVLMNDLITTIRELQSAAKQKYDSGDRTQLANYYIGEKLDNRSNLVQFATAIFDRLGGATPKDTLPGIKPAKIAQLESRLQAYKNIDLHQASAQGGASDARTNLSDQVNSISQRRRRIQFAADGQWPSSNPANAATRRQFELPPDRPLT